MECSKIPPRTEAVEQLENFINVNHLAAHTRIPSERDLCNMWGLNRTTLRFAVDALVDRGKLYRRKGFGTYVAEPKQIRNLMGVNSMSSEMRQHNVDLVTRILNMRTLEATKQVSKKLHIPLGHKVYEFVRVRSVNSIPCILETMWLNCQLCPDFDQYYQNNASVFSIFKNIYKLTPVRGEEKISVTYASPEEADALHVPEGTPAFFGSGVTELEDGTPLESYHALFRADQFKFVSVITQEEGVL